jgi:hypothetical protein
LIAFSVDSGAVKPSYPAGAAEANPDEFNENPAAFGLSATHDAIAAPLVAQVSRGYSVV